MKIDNFFAELKRRNVYKVALAYAVVAWLLIQAASILLPTFEAPTLVMKAFVVFLALGFVGVAIKQDPTRINPDPNRLRQSDWQKNRVLANLCGARLRACEWSAWDARHRR